jgi:putative transposase
MPRKPRIEYAGAVYHVLNRGNYGNDLFAVAKAGASFEETLFETCSRYGWRLHAYVLMPNHYHLAVETREANLAAGMQWLQSTFANRFNRIVRDRGHVFQGRYKALLIERGESLLRVVNYIHLNPVRARVKTLKTLRDYRLSSFPKYFTRRRPSCLDNTEWLALAGGLKPTPAGMRRYHRYLAFAAEADAKRRAELYRELCRGWYIGTREGKSAVVKAVAKRRRVTARPAEASGFAEARGALCLRRGLSRLGKTKKSLTADRKLAPWKVVLASWIKLQCGVSNRWFSEHMAMGNIYSISKAVTAEIRKGSRRKKLWKRLGPPMSKA